jgi:hypothetical protein
MISILVASGFSRKIFRLKAEATEPCESHRWAN